MGRIGKDTWLMLGVVAATVAMAVLLVYRPQSNRLDQIRAQIVSQERSLKTDSELASVVPTMLQQVEAMKRRYKDFDRRLPERQELGGFLREISSHVADENLSGQLIEPGSPDKNELFHTLPIIMRFKGSYLSVASFLKRLEGMERLTRVEKLQLTRDKKAIQPNELDVELQINIYFTQG